MRYQPLTLAVACCLSFAIFNAGAQSISNVSATFIDGRVTVQYDLTVVKMDQKYQVDLYCSHNNFASPLRQVLGDVGRNVVPGAGKQIIWNVAAEIGQYKGPVSFKVRGAPMPLPFSFKNPVEGGGVRRGKNNLITWEGGRPDQTVKLELFKGTERVATLADTKNTGEYAWSVPKDFSKGGGYSLKLLANQQIVSSGNFSVQSKVPLWVKLSPILLVGIAVIPFLGDGSEPGGTTKTPLPGPPENN